MRVLCKSKCSRLAYVYKRNLTLKKVCGEFDPNFGMSQRSLGVRPCIFVLDTNLSLFSRYLSREYARFNRRAVILLNLEGSGCTTYLRTYLLVPSVFKPSLKRYQLRDYIFYCFSPTIFSGKSFVFLAKRFLLVFFFFFSLFGLMPFLFFTFWKKRREKFLPRIV